MTTYVCASIVAVGYVLFVLWLTDGMYHPVPYLALCGLGGIVYGLVLSQASEP